MAHLPIVTCASEGGLYSPVRDPSAPIRIYADRRIRDDIFSRITGKKYRERLSPTDYRSAVRYSKLNRASGAL